MSDVVLGVSNLEQTTQLLEAVDEAIGVDSLRVALAANALSGIVSKAAVIVLPAIDLRSMNLSPDPQSGYIDGNGVYIAMPMELGYYEQYVSGRYAERLRTVKSFLRSRGVEVTRARMFDASFAHEYGHAHVMTELLAKGGMEELEAYYEEDAREMEHLPLGTASSDAADLWQHNYGGYRDDWMERGLDQHGFNDLLARNVIAYNDKRSEKEADDFAFDIMYEVYK